MLSVGWPHRSRYGSLQRRGAVLGDAVLHDLDAGGPERPAGHRVPPADQVGHLLDAEAALPPQGAHHVRRRGRRWPRPSCRSRPGRPCRSRHRRSRPATTSRRGSAGRPGPPSAPRSSPRPRCAAGGATPARSRPRAGCRSGGRRRPARSGRPAGRGSRGPRRRCASARELTQAPWWSRFGRKTGRSGTTVSRSAAVGLPPGKAGIAQPPPRIHATSGFAAAYAAIASRYSSRVECSDRSQRSRSSPPWIGCTCASTKPGDSRPPARSTTSWRRSSASQAATTRPSSTSTEPAPR